MDLDKYSIYLKGENKTSEIDSLRFEGELLFVKFKNNDKEYSYKKNSYEIVEKAKNHVLFNYYKDICYYFKNNQNNKDDKEDISFLYKEFIKMESSPIHKDSALYAFINPAKNSMDKKNNRTIIYPFGSNLSQSQAINNALRSKISIIEGPPGTGKTQTILNIIANLIADNKTVAVVSNNNSAIENVYEKLHANNYSFFCAILGNKKNKQAFIDNQTLKYPLLNANVLDKNDLTKKIDNINNTAYKIFELTNKQAKLKSELEDIKIEYEYFKEQENINENYYNMITNSKNYNKIKSSLILKIRNNINIKHKIPFFLKILLSYFYRLGSYDFYKEDIYILSNIFDRIFYEIRIKEIYNELEDIKKYLEQYDFNDILNKQKEYSLTYLTNALKEKYDSKKSRKKFTYEDFSYSGNEILAEYPVILSTTHAIKSSLDLKNNLYDYIIIDEASQVDLATGFLALSTARKAVIVGDTKQLKNIIKSENIPYINAVTEKYEIKSDEYIYTKQSLLSSVLLLYSREYTVMLKEHYRCHPKIIGFCNKKFYNNELIILSKDNNEKDVLMAVYTKQGNHELKTYNEWEVEEINKNFLPKLKKIVKNEEIGIVSPFLQQKYILQDIVDSDIQVDTVHKYQGREKDAIIFTTVRNNADDFINDKRLINVAVSRAKKYFYIVVSYDIYNSENNISDLIKYIQYNQFIVEESKVKSIFEMLYRNNREERHEFLKNKKLISQYDSENLAYNYINNFLKDYDNLTLIHHIPLYRIIKNVENLTADEINFIYSLFSHADLLIINKMDKKPVCAVEIDGYSYHSSKEQKQRDSLKNSIFKKYNIPLLRFNTKGHSELETLENTLSQIGYKKEQF